MLLAILIATLLFQLIYSSAQALMTTVAQKRLMTGRLGVLSMIAAVLPGAFASVGGGWLTRHLASQGIFLVAAGVTASLFGLAIWRPRSIFAGKPPPKIPDGEPPEKNLQALKRLIRHRPVWPAAIILFLWNFSPGLQTPLFYQLTNSVKLSSESYGLFMALFSLGFIPTALLYSVLCRRWSLWRLLWLGTGLAILQGPPPLFCHTTAQALIVAVSMGLLGGLGNAAYFDLLLRSCPKGLEGAASMLGVAAWNFAIRGGDLFGTWLYQRGGFTLAILITTAVYALIIPTLFLIPRKLVITREGEPGDP